MKSCSWGSIIIYISDWSSIIWQISSDAVPLRKTRALVHRRRKEGAGVLLEITVVVCSMCPFVLKNFREQQNIWKSSPGFFGRNIPNGDSSYICDLSLIPVTGKWNWFVQIVNTIQNGAELRPAIASGNVIGDAPVSYWPIFSLSPVTVPEVFMKVKSTKFSSCFFKLRMQTINKQYVPVTPLYWGDWVKPTDEPVYWPCSWNEEKKINVTVLVKFETTQLSIQHVLLVRVRARRQIWRNLRGYRSEVGVTRNVWRPHFPVTTSWKHNNNNNALQRQHKPRPATRHFREEYCQVTRKLKCYELQPRSATRRPK